MKRLVWSGLLLMASLSAWCQNKNLDSLYNLLKNHPQEDTVRVKLLTSICHLEYTSENEKNKVHANEALELSRKLNYISGIGTALKYKALYYWVVGDYEPATQYAIEMLRVFEGTSNTLGLSQAYNLLGLIHERTHDFENAKDYYLKALDIRQKAGLKRDVAYSYNSLGSLHFNLLKLEEAKLYFLKSLEIRKELNDEEQISQSYSNLAVVYMKQKDFTTALDYNYKALAILKKLDNKYRTALNYTNLGEVFINLGKFDKAEYYLVKSVELVKPMHHKEALVEIYEKLALLENTRARYDRALAYSELKHKYQDSIYTDKQAKQIAEVEARYETEKKDQTIHSLEQQKEFQNLKQWYLVIGLLALSITFVVIYVLQRSHSQKVNDLFENQKFLNFKLKEADQLKSKFFANISHEFRTPLTLILSPIESRLASSNINPGDKESLQMVTRNANRLLSLVNQLLDLSKLEAKKMELVVQRGDLKTFMRIVSASFDSLAESKSISFEKDIQFENNGTWFDADKLEKILNNVLINAFKFTTEGGSVRLSVRNTENMNNLEIIVSDTGKGISDEDQKNVFSPFYQSRYTTDDGQFGTGLGLSLVQELVNLHGGDITLFSELDKGTTVTITLPVNQESLPDITIYEEGDASNNPLVSNNRLIGNLSDEDEIGEEELSGETDHEDCILVVEDNDDLRNFVSSTFKDECTVLTAADGALGYEIAIDRIPDLIISDVMMPNLDGIQLTEKIKLDERTCHIPVVLLTAKADMHSKIEGLQTGADDYLSKPFSVQELKVRVANLIEQRKRLATKYKAEETSTVVSAPKIPSLDDRFLLKARQIVEDNISDSSFGVEKMADEIHLSRTQLFRKLKAISGLSPNEFINDIRLRKAAELILSKADTLTQISYSVGFNEQSYFAKRFRKKFGTAPSEYTGKSTGEV